MDTLDIRQYLGKPWQPMARGPDAFDCWGLVWDVYRRFLGLEIPLYQIDPGRLKAVSREIEGGSMGSQWRRIEKPSPLCAIGLSRSRKLHHVGLYVPQDGGLLLHANEGEGVVATPTRRLKAHGWSRIEFYEHDTRKSS